MVLLFVDGLPQSIVGFSCGDRRSSQYPKQIHYQRQLAFISGFKFYCCNQGAFAVLMTLPPGGAQIAVSAAWRRLQHLLLDRL